MATDARNRLVAAAESLFYAEGIRAVGVDQLLNRSGVGRASFYRHFASKDDLTAALVDAGARRLVGYLEHRMSLLDDPAARVRAWVRGVLSQAADPVVAEPTRAVAWNRTVINSEAVEDARRAESLIWALLEEPLAALGVAEPANEAYLVGCMVFAVLNDGLWADPPPTLDDLAFVTDFVLARINP